MLIELEPTNDRRFKDAEELKNYYLETYREFLKETPEMTLEEFISTKYYEDGDEVYIYDTKTGKVYEGNGMFKEVMK